MLSKNEEPKSGTRHQEDLPDVNSEERLHYEIEALFLDFPSLDKKYDIIDVIGEGTFSTVYKALSLEHRGELVALKRIYSMSSPARIANELRLLLAIGESPYVAHVLEGLRYRDQVILVLPFFEHDDFKECLDSFDLGHLRCYMKCLFEALRYIHSLNIIHRDVKPSNFLYSFAKKEGILVDFGLAQRVADRGIEPELNELSKEACEKRMNSASDRENLRCRSESKRSSRGGKAMLDHQVRPITTPSLRRSPQGSATRTPGVPINDTRPFLKASRAGTRGFRAPEATFQPAIDVWSVGVILLTILTGTYPFFHSPDDMTALAEMTCLFGRRKLRDCAIMMGRRMVLDEALSTDDPTDFHTICASLNPKFSSLIPESAFDLLEKCLSLDPRKRISAAEALKHDFFTI